MFLKGRLARVDNPSNGKIDPWPGDPTLNTPRPTPPRAPVIHWNHRGAPRGAKHKYSPRNTYVLGGSSNWGVAEITHFAVFLEEY